MEVLKEDSLRKMPYSALKSYAKTFGVKGNLKAEKIISSLLSGSFVSSEDSFVLEEQKILNSSNVRNCENEEDKENTIGRKISFLDSSLSELKIESQTATPRRGRYSKGSPIVIQVNEAKPSITATAIQENGCITSSGDTLKIESQTSTPRRETYTKESPVVLQVTEEKLVDLAASDPDNGFMNSDGVHLKIESQTSTPRRETYTKESPVVLQVNEEKLVDIAASDPDNSFMNSDGVQAEELLIQLNTTTPQRETFTKNPPHPQENTELHSAANTSRRETFTTVSPSIQQVVVTDEKSCSLETSESLPDLLKNSARKSRKSSKQKVSFVTPVRCSPRLNVASPGTEYTSVKDRPKTPFSGNNSSKKNVKFRATRVTPYKKISAFLRSRRSTPCRLESNTSRFSFATKGIKNDESVIFEGTPDSKKEDSISLLSTPEINKRDSSTPIKSAAKSKLFSPKLSTLKKQGNTSMKNVCTSGSKAKLQRSKTPDFKKIHQKAFEKMEAIDEYHKRKLEYSAQKREKTRGNAVAKSVKKEVLVKKKTPPSKIPLPLTFVPTVTTTKNLQLNFGVNPLARATRSRTAAESGVKVFSADTNGAVPKSSDSNIKKPKFDLAASLKRKLNYKPYTGAVKPLEGKNSSSACSHSVKNDAVEKIKSNLRKTRTCESRNKRFDLQMSKRMPQ